jgi:hypothetical protein
MFFGWREHPRAFPIYDTYHSRKHPWNNGKLRVTGTYRRYYLRALLNFRSQQGFSVASCSLDYKLRTIKELELELIQTHMTHKPLLWVEVGAHAVRKRSECCGVVEVKPGAGYIAIPQ